jgi:hypothetical protein
MKIQYTMTNFGTKQTVRKIQKTEPKMKGFTCVARERVLPERNAKGERLFYDANNRPYYASETEDGSHYQP